MTWVATISHERQYGIDEIVLLCIGKTNTAWDDHQSEWRNTTQVSRLEVDHDYAVIPIYNLEYYYCINVKLHAYWGNYTDSDGMSRVRVTCRPRIGSSPTLNQGDLGSIDAADGCEDKLCDRGDGASFIERDSNLYVLGDGHCVDGPRGDDDPHPGGLTGTGGDNELFTILNNGLIFTIHDPAWADKEITTVLVSAKNQRKLYGDANWHHFVDTTFDDYAKEGTSTGGSHNRDINSAYRPYNPYATSASNEDWWRLRLIRNSPYDGGGGAMQRGGGSWAGDGNDSSPKYSDTFKTLISKTSLPGGTVNAQGSIIVLQEGGSEEDCTNAGDGTITASTTRQGSAPYSETICQPPVEGDPSCDTSTLQQGSTSLEVEIACRNVMYVTEEGNIIPNPLTVDGKLSNITDVNFIASSGDDSYVITYAGMEGGMTVGQHLVSRTSRDPKDDKTVGFHVDYKDENDVIDSNTGQKKDRMFISAYDNEAISAGALTVMRSTDPGFVGINDIFGQSEIILPETIFNIQSTGDAVTRITSINSSHKASIQLLNPDNELREGFEIEYSQSTARADMSMFKNMGKKTVISIDRDTNKIGIHTVEPNELLTLSSGITGNATLSIQEQPLDPIPTPDYGKVYVKPIPDNDSQCQSLYFEDDCGNIFDLIFNPSTDYRMVYSDEECNTYVGRTPDRRDDILPEQQGNTGLGGGALYNVTVGDRNTAVGCNAGVGVTTGDDNLFLGKDAGRHITTGSENIIIGGDNSGPGTETNTIRIGTGLGDESDGLSESYDFRLGFNDPLIKGTLGPDFADRHLYLHREAPLSFESNDLTDLLTLRPKTTVAGVESWFEKVESAGNDYPVGTMDFVFTSKETDGTAIMTDKKLLTLSHDAAAMTNSCSYQVSSPARPIALLKGDLNIQGTINFCDGSSFTSSSGLVYAPGSGLNSSLNTTTGNTEFNLDIEELVFADSLSGSDTHLAVSTDNIIRKVNIDGLAGIIAEGEPRIIGCDGGTGQNHVFTNNSTIEDTTCYTNFFGHRAGDKASNSDFTNFIGAQAGAYEESVPANAVDSCSYSNFMGYRTGWETQNADHSVFIGSSAGYQADNSRVSVFIGDSAGMGASTSRSIGIGDNALESVVGQKNIELTVGMGGGDPARLIVGSQDYKLNIGDCIGGDMSLKKVSIGDARVDPDAVLEVKALTDDVRLQEWKDYNNNVVAYIDKDGKLYVNGGVVYSA